MQFFSTHEIPAKHKLDYWNGLTSDHIFQMDVEPVDKNEIFEAELYWQDLGPVSISKASSSVSNLRRTRKHIARNNERVFLLNLVDSGSFSVREDGKETVLQEGDFTLSDSAEPFEYSHKKPCTAIVLRIPEHILKSYIPVPEDHLNKVTQPESGIAEVFSVMMRNLGNQIPQGLSEHASSGVSHAILELLTCVFAGEEGVVKSESLTVRQWRLQIIRYIETNLVDPDLSPHSIASALNISGRYMRSIFNQSGETVTAYIIRRRIEETSRRLLDPAWNGRTISEIAFKWGFNSLGSFERAFKLRFGEPPREYRRRIVDS